MRQRMYNAKYYQSKDKRPAAKKMAVQAEDTEGLYQELTKELKKSKPNITVVYQTQQLTFKSRRKEVQNLHDTQAVLAKFPFFKVEESVSTCILK